MTIDPNLHWKEKGGDIMMKDLLHIGAWEIQESPIDLGYRVVPEWAMATLL
jgi:hypothetical protein